MKKVNMLEGNIFRSILIYTIPLVIGNFFQLLYATVDMAIVGNSSGSIGVDSVGAATPIINVVSFLIIGLSNGASILMSELYGKKDYEGLKKEIGLCITAISVVGIILSLGVIASSNLLLDMTNVKEEIYEGTKTYLITCMIGIIFLSIYNIYFAALRSIGDSFRPLIFLIISCILNIAFDFLFTFGFDLGVFGVALSTIISQAITMLICIFYAAKISQLFRFKLNDFKVNAPMLVQTSKYAVASALQQVVLHVGKSLVQSEINTLSIEEQAGFNIGTKIDDYAMTPAQCIGNAIAVFLAQNRGAKQRSRVKKGFLIGMLLELSFGLFVSILIFIVKRPFASLFTNDKLAITYTVKYVSIMVFLYLLPSTTNGLQSYFRGLGNLIIVFLSTLVQIIFRVSAAYIIIPKVGVEGGAYATLVGWIAMISFELPILIYFWKKNIKLEEKDEEIITI